MKRISLLTITVLLSIAGVVVLLSMLTGMADAAPALSAQEIHVCLSGCAYDTIQAAVDSANDGDVIKVAAGVYADVHSYPSPAGYGGSDVITQVVYIHKTVTIHGGYTTSDWGSADPAGNPTVLDAQKQGRVIFIAGDSFPVVEGFTIIDGDAHGLGGFNGQDAGGGIYVITATATIRENQIYGNTAKYGVGVFLQSANSSIFGNTIYNNNNITQGRGGGAYLSDSHADLSENVIRANSIGWDGGGLYSDNSAITLTNNSIISNTSSNGGGVSLFNTTGTLINNTIAYNSASMGGGISQDDGTSLYAGNVIMDNHATIASGGGYYIWGGKAILNSNTIQSNTTNAAGGGIYIDNNCQATIVGNRIMNNLATAAGGGASLIRSATALTGNQIISNTTNNGGAGLWLWGNSASINGNTIQGNIAQGENGGGIRMYQSDTIMVHNLIANNSTAKSGGGISIEGGSLVTLSGNIVVDNSAAVDGGGVFAYLGQSSWYNNIFLENQTGRAGSALFLSGSSYNLLHTTISHNIGGDGSGINVANLYDIHPSVMLTDTILVSQTVGITVSAGSQATLNGVLWFGNSENTGGSGTITKTNEHTGNPEFTSDGYHLLANSPAVNTGVPSGVSWDIDFEPRPYQGYDLGADEYWPAGVLKHVYLPLTQK